METDRYHRKKFGLADQAFTKGVRGESLRRLLDHVVNVEIVSVERLAAGQRPAVDAEQDIVADQQRAAALDGQPFPDPRRG
jgi:hypothetical protein